MSAVYVALIGGIFAVSPLMVDLLSNRSRQLAKLKREVEVLKELPSDSSAYASILSVINDRANTYAHERLGFTAAALEIKIRRRYLLLVAGLTAYIAGVVMFFADPPAEGRYEQFYLAGQVAVFAVGMGVFLIALSSLLPLRRVLQAKNAQARSADKARQENS